MGWAEAITLTNLGTLHNSQECMKKENGSITVFLADHKLYFSLPKIAGCNFLLHKFLRYFGL